jgi:O-antigen ligase
LLLVSTSTGCVFSYLALLVCVGFLKLAKVIKKISLFISLWKFLFGISLFFVCLWIIDSNLVSYGFLKFFWTGIAYHPSVRARWLLIQEYWDIFLENPILGVGLGGSAAYCAKKLELPLSPDDPLFLALGSASNVSLEVLGSLGLLGALMFGCFFYTLWKNSRITLRLPLTREERIDMISLIVSLCVMFFTLQFNGSIMRPYTWLHVGVCVGYMKFLYAKYRLQK